MDADERLKTLMNCVPAGMLWIHPEQGILELNARAVSCIGAPGAEALVGKPLHGANGMLPRMNELVATAASGDASPCYCYSGPSAFKKHVELQLWIQAPPEGAQSPLWMIYMEDHYERRKAEQSVIQREKFSALDSIIAGVAHELNNPMTAILGYTELLLQRGMDPKIHTKLARIAQETERCRKIVGSMLTYAERNRAPLAVASLNDVLEEVILLSAYQLRVDDIDITYRLDPAIPPFALQREPLQRAFLHIFNNAHLALLAKPAAPRFLVIESAHKGPHALVKVRDNGPGISPAVMSRIFDPFFTTRGVGEGMGLGLSTAMGVVKDHRGQIWAESAPGEGATFSMEFPYAPAAPLPPAG